MGIVQLTEKQGNIHIKDWHNAYLSPTKRRGAVAVVQWNETKDGKTVENRQWITPKNTTDFLKKTDGTYKRLTNAYLTLNAFEKVNGQTRRRTSNLAQIRNIGVDIDCYNVGMTPEQARSVIQDMIIQCEIPNPNLFIWSGNGIQLIYSIESGASPSLSWLTSHITTQLVAKTSALGSDASCTDLTRVFRLPGSYNAKPGKETKLVRVELWRTLEYDLSELYAYCEPLEHRKKRISKPHLYPLPKMTDMGYKLRSLNLTRINDIYKIIDLRNGNIANRNVLLYDFSYLFGLQTDIEDAVIQQATRMNDSLDDPLSMFEVERVAKNAFRDARAFWKAYLDNGYRMPPFRKKDGLIRPKKTTTLIKHHGISKEEMKELDTIIDEEESYGRKVAKRRASGMKTLQEHNDNQKQQKAQRIYLIAKLKAENPGATQRQLANLAGLSVGTVNNLLKELN